MHTVMVVAIHDIAH